MTTAARYVQQLPWTHIVKCIVTNTEPLLTLKAKSADLINLCVLEPTVRKDTFDYAKRELFKLHVKPATANIVRSMEMADLRFVTDAQAVQMALDFRCHPADDPFFFRKGNEKRVRLAVICACKRCRDNPLEQCLHLQTLIEDGVWIHRSKAKNEYRLTTGDIARCAQMFRGVRLTDVCTVAFEKHGSMERARKMCDKAIETARLRKEAKAARSDRRTELAREGRSILLDAAYQVAYELHDFGVLASMVSSVTMGNCAHLDVQVFSASSVFESAFGRFVRKGGDDNKEAALEAYASFVRGMYDRSRAVREAFPFVGRFYACREKGNMTLLPWTIKRNVSFPAAAVSFAIEGSSTVELDLAREGYARFCQAWPETENVIESALAEYHARRRSTRAKGTEYLYHEDVEIAEIDKSVIAAFGDMRIRMASQFGVVLDDEDDVMDGLDGSLARSGLVKRDSYFSSQAAEVEQIKAYAVELFERCLKHHVIEIYTILPHGHPLRCTLKDVAVAVVWRIEGCVQRRVFADSKSRDRDIGRVLDILRDTRLSNFIKGRATNLSRDLLRATVAQRWHLMSAEEIIAEVDQCGPGFDGASLMSPA